VASRRSIRSARELIGVEYEDSFEVKVMRLAKLYGWCGYHVRFSVATTRGIHLLVRDGHMDGYGWPDWVFVKDGHPPKYRELKTEVGQVSRHQKFWQRKLAAAGADVDVWRPSMLDQIFQEFAA